MRTRCDDIGCARLGRGIVSLARGIRRRVGAIVVGAVAVVACLATSAGSPAAAQSIEACKTLAAELQKLAQAVAPKEAGTTDAEPDRSKNLGIAIKELAKLTSPFRVELSGQRFPGGGVAWASFDDKRIAAISPANAAKFCVQVYVLQGDKPPSGLPVKEAFLTDQNDAKVQRLKVVFDVPAAGARGLSSTVDLLLVGALADSEKPILFSYFAAVPVSDKAMSSAISLFFVAVAYLLLAAVTYDKEAKELKGVRWLAYTLSPVRISAGMFGDASMSQIQVLLFTFVVAGLLFHLWLRTGLLADIPNELLILLGISAVGAGGARFTATLKTGLSDGTAQYLIGKGWYDWPQNQTRQQATFANLFITDGRLDVYKFQMAIFTVVVALYVIASGQNDLGEVKISETMLYLIGISQGVYVGGKAITDRTTDLENAVKKMMDIEKKSAADRATDTVKAEFGAAAQVAAEDFASLYQVQIPREANGRIVAAILLPPV